MRKIILAFGVMGLMFVFSTQEVAAQYTMTISPCLSECVRKVNECNRLNPLLQNSLCTEGLRTCRSACEASGEPPMSPHTNDPSVRPGEPTIPDRSGPDAGLSWDSWWEYYWEQLLLARAEPGCGQKYRIAPNYKKTYEIIA